MAAILANTALRPSSDATCAVEKPALQAYSVTKVYGTPPGETHALNGIDLRIELGESVAIMGPSGSGKTTLLQVLAGVLRPTSGIVYWGDRDLAVMPDRMRTLLRRSDFGFVFQTGQLLPELPADENAALPLLLAGVPRQAATARAAEQLTLLGLAGLEQRRPGELSGGQAQRVAIARALVANPKVIFADEPTGALDTATGWEVMRALTSAAKAHGAALVVVTHNLEVAHWCARTITMSDGRVVDEARQTPDAPAAPAPAADVDGCSQGISRRPRCACGGCFVSDLNRAAGRQV